MKHFPKISFKKAISTFVNFHKEFTISKYLCNYMLVFCYQHSYIILDGVSYYILCTSHHLWLIIPKTIYGHVIFLNEHWNIKLCRVYDAVQLFHLKSINIFLILPELIISITSYTLCSFCLMAGAMKVVNHQEVSLVHMLGCTV